MYTSIIKYTGGMEYTRVMRRDHYKCKKEAFEKLALWHNEIEDAGIGSFKTVTDQLKHTTSVY